MAKDHNIHLPTEFSGPAQLILYTRYGDPREAGWENKWIDKWHVKEEFPWFPQEYMEIHKHFKPMLRMAFNELETAGLSDEIKSFEGCFKLRNAKTNTSVLSLHAWGVAIDMNSEANPHGSLGNWSEEFLEIMSRNNICCGQNWTGRKDPMHFAMFDG